MFKNEKVLVTGAAGYIGRHLVGELISQQVDMVYLVDRPEMLENSLSYYSDEQLGKIRLLPCNLMNDEEVDALPSCDYVFHLAAINGTQIFYEKPWYVFSNSLQSTLNMIYRYGEDEKLQNFIYTSTSEVYADLVPISESPVPTNEFTHVGFKNVANPRWSYGGAKLAGEIAVYAAQHQLDMPFSILRYHNVYGPNMGPNHVIPDFITRGEIGIYELFGGNNVRSFIFIRDAIRATLLVATHPQSRNRITHVGNSDPISMVQLAEKIMRIKGWSGDIEVHPAPVGSVHYRCPDVKFLRETLGFKSEVDLETGLSLVLLPSSTKGF